MRNKVSQNLLTSLYPQLPPGGEGNEEEGKGSFWDANNRETTWGEKAAYHIYQVANSCVKILIQTQPALF